MICILAMPCGSAICFSDSRLGIRNSCNTNDSSSVAHVCNVTSYTPQSPVTRWLATLHSRASCGRSYLIEQLCRTLYISNFGDMPHPPFGYLHENPIVTREGMHKKVLGDSPLWKRIHSQSCGIRLPTEKTTKTGSWALWKEAGRSLETDQIIPPKWPLSSWTD